jgi:hypothetical protein
VKRAFLVVVLGAGLAGATPSAVQNPADEQGATAEEVALEAGGETDGESGFDEIPEAYRKAYFEKKPDGFLIDPQRLLGPVVGRDRSAFLKYHAGDSSIDLHVYLLGGNQKIPDATKCEELVEKFFSKGKPSAVAFYPFGAPERTVLHLSPGLKEAVPDAENKRALASSVMQAVEKSDPSGQLEAFLVQMSIRLYWMERMLGKEDAVVDEAADLLPERSKEAVMPEEGLSEKLEPLLALVREWALEVGAVFGVGLLMVLALVWSRLRARRVLPDFVVEPRLGGEHGAGVGAVISFANASVPPASQRGRMG